MPKQFHKLTDRDYSLFQLTAKRLENNIFMPPVVIGAEDHRFIMAQQLNELGINDYNILLEPYSRNTAPAVIMAALAAQNAGADYVLVLPSDHHIKDESAFIKNINSALGIASNGRFVLFGIKPDHPHTGYGYIERNSENDEISSFIEKPSFEHAQELIDSEDIFWNSGIFLLPVNVFLNQMKDLNADLYHRCQNAYQKGVTDLDFFRIDANEYEGILSQPIDKALFEKTDKASVVEATFQWLDVGSWDALYTHLDKGNDGNVIKGKVVTHNVKNSYLRSDGPLLAVNGLDNHIVVATHDAIMVTPKDMAQDVRTLVTNLQSNEYKEADDFPTIFRPWGSFNELHAEPDCNIIKMNIKPGHKLTLQQHHHRSEHWVVLNGELTLTTKSHVGLEEIKTIRKGESAYVSPEHWHRLENRADRMLQMIEVQIGDVIRYDDVERVED